MSRKVLSSIALVVFVAALAVGLFGRFYGLGSRSLAIDEYYTAKSVSLILEHGFPVFPSGGFYTRALIPNYGIAATVVLLGNTGFALRLTPVLWSLGSIGLAYLFCRRFVGVWPSAAVAVALLVSSWHIEFARFARMYSAFQFTTLLYCLAVIDAYLDDKPGRRYLPHLAFLAMTLTHQMAILLAPLLFLPLFGPMRKRWFPTRGSLATFGLAGISLTAFSYLVPKLSRLGVHDRFPPDYVEPTGGRFFFRLTEFPFWGISDDPTVNVLLVCGLLGATGLVLAAWRTRRGTVSESEIVAALMVVSSATHTFLLSALFFFALLYRYRVDRVREHSKRLYVMIGLAVAFGVGWLGYAASVGHASVGQIRRAFFGWPDVIEPLLRPAAKEFPLLGFLVLVASFYQLAVNARRPWSSLIRNPAILSLYVVLTIGMLRAPYVSLRYFYFVYPVMLCTVALTLTDILSRLGGLGRRIGTAGIEKLAAALLLALFALSADFEPTHLANIDSERVTYRTDEYERHRITWYLRRDYESPARFLNSIGAFPDSMIIIENTAAIDYYLNREFTVYHGRRGKLFRNTSRRQGTVDRWSNRPLISTPEELRERTTSARRVWIVRPTDLKASFDIASVWGERLASQSRVFTSRDRRIEIVEVILAE